MGKTNPVQRQKRMRLKLRQFLGERVSSFVSCWASCCVLEVCFEAQIRGVQISRVGAGLTGMQNGIRQRGW